MSEKINLSGIREAIGLGDKSSDRGSSDLVSSVPTAEPVQPAAAPANLPGGGGGRQFGEVHDTHIATGERLNQSALVMAQVAITLAKLGRLGNAALTKLLDIDELVGFDDSGDNFTNVARAWVATVVDPDVKKIADEATREKWEKELGDAGKDEQKIEEVKHRIGQEMIQNVAKKIEDYIAAEDARVKEWLGTSRQTMITALQSVRGALPTHA